MQLCGKPAYGALLKRTYRCIEQQSYLDWGLTSDYDAGVTQKQLGFKVR